MDASKYLIIKSPVNSLSTCHFSAVLTCLANTEKGDVD